MVPTWFLAHGSPMLAIEDTEYSRFLENLGKRVRPKAIVIFTAHWETHTLTISSRDDVYETIYDFGGFPDELYAVKYPAKGSRDVAAFVSERMQKQGIPVALDSTRGLDHGSWTLLHRLYPAADLPVVQVSVNPNLPPSEQYRIGQALQDLGIQDILVIGSGVTVHNLRILKWGQTTAEPWAIEFDDWLIEQLESGDLDALFDYEKRAPHARLAVPRAEHFVPFFLAMGAGGSSGADGSSSAPSILHRSYDLGTLSYLCLEF